MAWETVKLNRPWVQIPTGPLFLTSVIKHLGFITENHLFNSNVKIGMVVETYQASYVINGGVVGFGGVKTSDTYQRSKSFSIPDDARAFDIAS